MLGSSIKNIVRVFPVGKENEFDAKQQDIRHLLLNYNYDIALSKFKRVIEEE